MTSVSSAAHQKSTVDSVNHLPIGQLAGRQVCRLTVQQIKWTGYVLGTALIFAAMYKLYNFWRLDQMTSVECPLDERLNFSYYEGNANNGVPEAQHCLATMFKTGRGVAKSIPSARMWYKKAADQGLHLSRVELCRPSTFADWSKQQRDDAESGEWADLCCPPKSTCLCPWLPVFLSRLEDPSFAPGRFFPPFS